MVQYNDLNLMELAERKEIIKLINSEVVPAIGCTEPIAVALCVAKATEILGTRPEKINVKLSANMLKNAMGVGIPGTGMVGLPIAIALGALIGKSEYQLEVLKDCTPAAVELGKAYIAEKRISIEHKDTTEKLYIEVLCSAGNETATAIIAGIHTNFILLKKNNDVIMEKALESNTVAEEEGLKLTLKKVYEFATTAPLDELRFILESAKLNGNVSKESLKGNYGHESGRLIAQSDRSAKVLGNSIYTHILAETSAACDARMAGAMFPVMSNSGSGNQGISATMPVVVFARDNGNTEEEYIRALVMSHLTVIYIKQSLGRLSALCGCVVAATGSSCGITMLMGGGYEQICSAVKNMVGNISGMLCDGAKPSCALKVTSGVSSAVLAALLAMEGKCVSAMEGIVDDDVDQTIRNLTRIGRDGMNETDRVVLDIMTHKK